MKLFAHGPQGAETLGVLDGDRTFDLVPLTSGARTVDRALLEAGLLPRVRAALDAGELPALDPGTLAGGRRGAPVTPGKIVCIGLNYRDHAAETGAAIPAEPILFMKAPDTIGGPDDDVLIPAARPAPTGRSSWASSSAPPCGTRRAPRRPSRPSAATSWPTTSPSGSSRSSAAGPGTRARTARRSPRWGPGS